MPKSNEVMTGTRVAPDIRLNLCSRFCKSSRLFGREHTDNKLNQGWQVSVFMRGQQHKALKATGGAIHES